MKSKVDDQLLWVYSNAEIGRKERHAQGEVETAIGHLDELLDDALTLELLGVDKVGRAHLVGPFLLVVIGVDRDDLAGLSCSGSLDDSEADASYAKDGDSVTLLDVGGDGGGSVACGNSTSEQARLVEGSLLVDGDDRVLADDRVLGEGRRAHEVEELLALALESGSSVRHHSFTLGRSDLAAKVGLSALAELALLALCRVQGDDVVSDLDVRHTLSDALHNSTTCIDVKRGQHASIGPWFEPRDTSCRNLTLMSKNDCVKSKKQHQT